MADIACEKALTKIGNGFILTTILAQRVKELRQGAKPLVETTSEIPIEIALQEISAGKVTYKLPEYQND
ncbi:DNA-directed RNA polymerase subunit omega [bacterium]|nr:DNA-directed RNA polymerase subunit omega [bacterium]